jgi:hypothetical protein
MGTIADFLGMATTLLMFAMVGAGVMKLFQLATDVREMKEALQDIRRNTQDSMPPSAVSRMLTPATLKPGVPTPEELVRAVHAQSFADDEYPQ